MLSVSLATAQQLPVEEQWRWRSFTTADGLPSNTVLGVLEDGQGQLWARTSMGFAWFDGYRWHQATTWRSESVMPHQAGLLALQGAQIWTITRSGARLHPFSEAHPEQGVASILPLTGDTLAVLASGQLYHYTPDALTQVALPPGEPPTDWLPWKLRRTDDGSVWLNTAQALFRRQGATWQRWMAPGVDHLAVQSTFGVASSLAGPATQGLWYWTDTEAPQRVDQRLVQTLDTHASGAAVVAYVDGRVRHRTPDGDWHWLTMYPEALRQPRHLHYQDNGNLWAATDQGVYLFQARWPWWAQDRPPAPAAMNQINEIIQTRQGDLWLGTHRGVMVHHAAGTTTVHTEALGQPLGGITAMAEDPQGGVWIASGGGVMGTFRWNQGQWYRGPSALDGLAIHRIETDRQGQLWFLSLNPSTGPLSPFAPVAIRTRTGEIQPWPEAPGLNSRRVYTFAEAPDGAYWFGTRAGLSRFHQGQWQHWTDAEGLTTNRVFALAISPSGTVWFTHQQGGLGYLTADGTPQYIGTDQPSMPNEVWDLSFSEDGVLWFTSTQGLGRYEEGHIAFLGAQTGLRHPRLWPLWPTDNNVYVGSFGGGLYTLDRAALQEYQPLRIDIDPPLGDQQSRFLQWSARSFFGLLAKDQILTRYRLDDGDWSDWSTSQTLSLLNLSDGYHHFYVQARDLLGRQVEAEPVVFSVPSSFFRSTAFYLLLLVGLLGLMGFALTLFRRRRQYLLEVRERERYFRSLIEHAMDLILVIAPDGTVHYQSPSVQRLLGYAPSAWQNQSVLSFIHPEDQVLLANFLDPRIPMAIPPPLIRLRLRHQNGPWRTFETYARHTETTDGTLLTVLNARDVTEREESARQIHQLNAELEARVHQRTTALRQTNQGLAAANRELESFSYSVSHDLRAPLRAINGYADLLSRRLAKHLDDTNQRYLGNIVEASQRMDRLINDLLRYARLGRGSVPQHRVDVHLILNQMQQVFAGRLADCEGQLSFPNTPLVVAGNTTLIEQILSNLISNALTYRREGVPPKVNITYEIAEEDAVIHLADNGIGISSEYLETVFQVFQRLHPQEAYSGTGIGLAVVKKAAEMLGGGVHVTSVLGQGSTFSVRLPLAKESKPASIPSFS